MRKLAAVLAVIVTGMTVCPSAFAEGRPDGALIVNSGSTNTLGWSIAFRSNGRGIVGGRTFSVSPPVASRFFADVAAARAAHALGGHCMKSASFGTRLNVRWHGWLSPDLSCPSGAPTLGSLGEDVARIVAAANVPNLMPRRIRIPVEPRRLPESTPSPSVPLPTKGSGAARPTFLL
ncbi:MAG TPA: hypothetical protein VIN40_00260 [Candidatus Tyrphobacter sp.]